MAYMRLLAVLRHLDKNPRLREQYEKIIQEQLDTDKIKIVAVPKQSHGRVVHYLAHLPVVREDNVTTKLRVVFAGNGKTHPFPSLNECLETGPKLLAELTGILLRFRTYRYVICSDIEKAFMQIAISQKTEIRAVFYGYREWKDHIRQATSSHIVSKG